MAVFSRLNSLLFRKKKPAEISPVTAPPPTAGAAEQSLSDPAPPDAGRANAAAAFQAAVAGRKQRRKGTNPKLGSRPMITGTVANSVGARKSLIGY